MTLDDEPVRPNESVASENRNIPDFPYSTYTIKKSIDSWAAVPDWLGNIDISDHIERENPSVIWATDTQYLKETIDLRKATRGIEYLGWSPAFEAFGDCGNHPQFAHRNHPPKGWHFTASAPSRIRSGKYIWADTLDELFDVFIERGLLENPGEIGSSDTELVIAESVGSVPIQVVRGSNAQYSLCADKVPTLLAAKNKTITKDAVLVCPNFNNSNYNIIESSGLYFGLMRSDGPFFIRKFFFGGYSHPLFVSDSLEELKDLLSSHEDEASQYSIQVGKASSMLGVNVYWANQLYYATRHHVEIQTLEDIRDLLRNENVIEAGTIEGLLVECERRSWIDVSGRADSSMASNLRILESNNGRVYQSLDELMVDLAQISPFHELQEISGRLVPVFGEFLATHWKIFRLYGTYLAAPPGDSRILSFEAAPYVSDRLPGSGNVLGVLKTRARLAYCASELVVRSIINGGKIADAITFLKSRHKGAQFLLKTKAEVVFVPSVPFVINQYPWVIEIEDIISFFFPFLHNGDTSQVVPEDLRIFPYFKALVESRSCRAIITHVKSTAEGLPKVFGNENLTKKIHYIPMGTEIPVRSQRTLPADNVNILFSSSWHQNPQSFYLRGGLDTLHAFRNIASQHRCANLVLRSAVPEGPAAELLGELVADFPDRVHVYSGFLPKNDWHQLLCNTDIFVLPSARIHVVSLLEAMSYGIPMVVSDGWGIDDYVDDGRTGVLVPGRYGVVSWYDDVSGMLHENYEPMHQTDIDVVNSLSSVLDSLISNPEQRSRLGNAAIEEVRERFSLQNWNEALKIVLDNSV